jgi:hypothetical protein
MPRNRQGALNALTCLAVAGLALASCRDNRTPPVGPEPAVGSEPQHSATVPSNGGGQCMVDDVNTYGGGPTNCTANDISIARAYPTGGGLLQCTPGASVTVDLTAELQATSNAERQDIGAWIANDGGSAKTGSCTHYNLPPGTTNTVNGDGDQCAGMSSSPTPNAQLSLGTITLQCNNIITIDGQTYLHVGSCLSWTVPGQDDVCSDDRDGNGIPNQPTDFRAATIPGTPAKCNCEGFNIPVQVVSQLTIVKNAIPDDEQDFAYATSGAGLSGFSLDDDGDVANTLSNTKTFTGLVNDPAITRSVTETVAAGWKVTGIACSGATQSTVTIGASGGYDAGDNSVSVLLKAGENVSCTFTNTKQASIKIVKNTVPDGGQDFTYTQNVDNTGNFLLDDDADNTLSSEKTFSNVDPSTTGYTVTESAATGYDLTALVCDDPIAGNASTTDLASRTATVRVDPGETVTCTFTNTANATFSVRKLTLGGTGTFNFTTGGTGPALFTAFNTLTTTQVNVAVSSATFSLSGAELDGAKFVTELAAAGWTLTAIQCDGNGATILYGTGQGAGFVGDGTFDATDNTVKVTFAAGSSPSCTFVNTIASIGRLTPTNTACIDFKTAPDAAANTLEVVEYSTKAGVISQVNPGVFFYYSQIEHTGGNLTITTDQIANPAFTEFQVHNYPATSQVKLYDANCKVIGTATISFLDGGTRVQVSLQNAPAGTYYLGIKFNPGTVVGEAINGTQVVYTFTTSVNGGGAINSDNLTLKPKQ